MFRIGFVCCRLTGVPQKNLFSGVHTWCVFVCTFVTFKLLATDTNRQATNQEPRRKSVHTFWKWPTSLIHTGNVSIWPFLIITNSQYMNYLRRSTCVDLNGCLIVEQISWWKSPTQRKHLFKIRCWSKDVERISDATRATRRLVIE